MSQARATAAAVLTGTCPRCGEGYVVRPLPYRSRGWMHLRRGICPDIILHPTYRIPPDAEYVPVEARRAPSMRQLDFDGYDSPYEAREARLHTRAERRAGKRGWDIADLLRKGKPENAYPAHPTGDWRSRPHRGQGER